MNGDEKEVGRVQDHGQDSLDAGMQGLSKRILANIIAFVGPVRPLNFRHSGVDEQLPDVGVEGA